MPSPDPRSVPANQTAFSEQSLAIAREFTDRAKSRIEIVPDESTRDLLDEVADLAFQRVS